MLKQITGLIEIRTDLTSSPAVCTCLHTVYPWCMYNLNGVYCGIFEGEQGVQCTLEVNKVYSVF